MAFITELPADENGNRLYTAGCPAVIEVELIDQYTYRVIAPESLRSKWPMIRQWADRWQEVEGPARLLSKEEYQALTGDHDNAS